MHASHCSAIESAIDSALCLCDVILARESLRHPKHAAILGPITASVEKVLADYFGEQKRALVHWLKYRTVREDAAADRKAKQILPDSLSPLTFGVTTHEAQAYQRAIEEAVSKAAAQLAEELEYTGTLPSTAMQRYLQDNSLAKLTGELESTTTQQLRDAIAEAVGRGATSDEIVQTIEATMDGFSRKRAEMIAQTEVNQAYNFGRHAIAERAGMNEKSWATESDSPCPVCVANEDEGWIPIGQEFSSGDQYPTAHPRCYCSSNFRSAK